MMKKSLPSPSSPYSTPGCRRKSASFYRCSSEDVVDEEDAPEGLVVGPDAVPNAVSLLGQSTFLQGLY